MNVSPCGIYPINNVSAAAARDFPLVKAICNCKVVDIHVVTELTQEYTSNAPDTQQVTYAFPLPPSAAVCSFKAVIDDHKVINGVIKAKEDAKRLYEDAVAKGKQAGLMHKVHVDCKHLNKLPDCDLCYNSIHCIIGKRQAVARFLSSEYYTRDGRADDRTTFSISYVSMISHDGSSSDTLRLTIPVIIASRYGTTPVFLPGTNNSNVFSLNVSLQMNGPITTISSPTHLINTVLGRNSITSDETHNPNHAIVALQESTFLEKDIVVVISAQNLDHPRCFAERWWASDGAEETTNAYALTMVPRFNHPPIKSQEYIFLVDRSGSMEGPRINSVKDALQIMLRSLPSRHTKFNIISFGSRNTSLWPTSQQYNADTVDHASRQVESFEADYGGTELAWALNIAYESKTRSDPAEKPSTVVFILTDGGAWDLGGIVDRVASSTKSAAESNHLLRTFVLGVGDSVAVGICESIARVGNGTAVFVGYNEKPEAKLVGLLRAARMGVVENIDIDWGIAGEESKAEDDFEMVDATENDNPAPHDAQQSAISLFDPTLVPNEPPETGPKEVELSPPPVIQQVPKSSALSFPIYPGFRCSIFAIIKQKSETTSIPSTVKIRGEAQGVPIMLEVPIQRSPNHDPAHLLHTLAARALVEGFEDEGKSATATAEITRLGLRYTLATSATSFVAVEEEGSELLVIGEAAPRVGSGKDYDVMEYKDYLEEFDDSADDAGASPAYSPASPAYSPASPRRSLMSPVQPSAGAGNTGEYAELFCELADCEPQARLLMEEEPDIGASMNMASRSLPVRGSEGTTAPLAPLKQTLTALAQAQGFDGAFMNNPSTVDLLLQGSLVPSIPKALDQTSFAVRDKENLWVTIIALAVLEIKYGSEEERTAWILMAEKAMEFARGMLLDVGLTEQDAESILASCKGAAMTMLEPKA